MDDDEDEPRGTWKAQSWWGTEPIAGPFTPRAPVRRGSVSDATWSYPVDFNYENKLDASYIDRPSYSYPRFERIAAISCFGSLLQTSRQRGISATHSLARAALCWGH